MQQLRDYQDWDLWRIVPALASGQCVLVAYCVGSGKTLLAMAAAARMLRDGAVTHVIVATPSRPTMRQFTRCGKRVGSSKGVIDLPGTVSTQQGRGSGREQILRYVATGRPKSVFVTSYNIVRDNWVELERHIDAKRTLVILDEGHHIQYEGEAENMISETVAAFRKLGGPILKLTATPIRFDEIPVVGEHDLRIERSLIDHILEGYAPSPILSEVVKVPGADRSEGSGLAETLFIPVDEDRGFEMLAQHVKDEGCKAIVRLKPFSTESNHRRVLKLRAALEKVGLTYIDATDAVEPGGDDRLAVAIDLENPEKPRKRRLHVDEVCDVVISFHRMSEGTNLPSRSHVYFWGVPRSVGLFEQVLGRAMRLRIDKNGRLLIEDYPERWGGQSKVVLFVGDIEDFETEHARILLRLAVFLGSFEDLSVFGAFNLIGSDGLSEKRANRANAAEAVKHVLGVESTAAAQQLYDKVYNLLMDAQALYAQYQTRFDDPMRPHEWARMICVLDPSLDPKVVERLVKLMAAMDGGSEARTRLNTLLSTGTERGVDDASGYGAIFDEAVEQVLEEFRDQCQVSTVLQRMTGDAASWARSRVFEYLGQADRPENLAEIMAGVDAFRDANGSRYPLMSDRDPLRNWRFQDYQRMISKGFIPDVPRDAKLGQLIIDRDSSKVWHARLRGIADEILNLRKSASPGLAALAGNRREMLKRYQHVPEMVYFPNAWKVALRSDASNYTLEEADRIGSG